MNCETAARHLRAYIDDELETGHSAALAGHLSGCAACARKLALMKATKASFQGLGPKATTADFELRLKEKLSGLRTGEAHHTFLRSFLDKILSYKGPVLAPATSLVAVFILTAVLGITLRHRHSADSIVESYFAGRTPYYQALSDRHEIPENAASAYGEDRCAWSGCTRKP